MTIIESDIVTISAVSVKVKDYIIDPNNLQHLLPEGKFSDWKSDASSCSFRIQNAYTIGLELASTSEDEQVVYRSSAGSPFAFTLTAHLNDVNGFTEAKLVCHAEMNSFLEMIVKSPLRNLFNHMANKMSHVKL
ncbi:MAG: hypothetical protein ACKOW8_05345 [Flavobacteriales bacterium]